MAGAAKKKAAAAKASAKGTYVPVVAAACAFYAFVRLWYRGATAERFHYLAFAGSLVVYAVTVPTAIESAAAPGTLASYFFDVMALTVVAQCLGAFYDWSWYLLLVVPGFAVFKALAFWFSRPSAPKAAEPEEEEDAGPSKKERKAALKQKRMKGR
mmetsp:Transcript_24811/g.76523  ORF Transcript_24811/g.76523 Transcript_24811/m.76523 type:complete len:156 (-) Transcript_24811:29-496(-)